MPERVRLVHYFDYKSPYAWLAQEAVLAVGDRPGVELVLRPYTLDIPSYLGRAELGEGDELLVDERNEHQWRRVRYAYMDCRREAARRGLVLRGPRRIFDSSIAHIAFLYACERGGPVPFHLEVFARFFRRDLDLEDPRALIAALEHGGIDPAGFPAYLAGPGRESHDRGQVEAEALGVFGVPSYLVEGQLYWGAERLGRVIEHLDRHR